MKFYETHFDEYVSSVEKNNLHPKIEKHIFSKFPNNIKDLKNVLFYGPPGVGKYSQMLSCVKKYSPSDLKYEKRFTITFNKQDYHFKISDIHYEVDMGILGCNSKLLWHDIYQQIIDVISAKNDKHGIIVCKNFHSIHNELLEIFYSYMQQYNHPNLNIQIKYILVTEHLCFIPNNILQCSRIVNVKRPSTPDYSVLGSTEIIEPSCILNMKEIKGMKYISDEQHTPSETFDIVCNELLTQMENYQSLHLLQFRDTLYDILVYNLDVTECFWDILTHFIRSGQLTDKSISDILLKTHSQLKYYNNNYRPIYHLETLFITIINHIQSNK